MLGGMRDSGHGTYVPRDLLTFNTETWKWSSLGQNPYPRVDHASTVFGDTIISHGGYLPFLSPETQNTCYFANTVVYNIREFSLSLSLPFLFAEAPFSSQFVIRGP